MRGIADAAGAVQLGALLAHLKMCLRKFYKWLLGESRFFPDLVAWIRWLTFRRTYASWAPAKGVPDEVLAALLGHANVSTTLNVYTQVLTPSLREAADSVGAELFTIFHRKRARN